MFEKKVSNGKPTQTEDSLGVFRPAKGSAKLIVGNGIKIKGEITNADEAQIDGNADIIITTDNLLVGSTGILKGTITSHNADIWGKMEGDVKITGTLTVQDQGNVSGSIEYQNLQIKLGGKIQGDIKLSEKVKKISDVQNKEISAKEELLNKMK